MQASLHAPAPELYYAACSRISALAESLRRWEDRGPSTDADAVALIQVLRKGCQRLRTLADEHLVDWKSGKKDRKLVEASLAFLTASAADLNSYLAIFEARAADKGIPEIALPLKLILEGVAPASKQHRFVFHPTHEFNFYYADLYQLLAAPLLLSGTQAKQQFLVGLPPQVALVAYSSVERKNVLTLIVLVHELSHYVDQVLQLRNSAPSPNLDPAKLDAWLKEAKKIGYVPEPLLKQYGSQGKVPAKILDFSLRLILIQQVSAADTWVRELTADCLAARLLGIGFFLTQRKFLGFFPGEDQGEYPPHYRRFQAIAQELLNPQYGVERRLAKGSPLTKRGRHAAALKRILSVLRKHHAEAGNSHASRVQTPTAASPNDVKLQYLRLLARDVIEDAIKAPLDHVTKAIRQTIPDAGGAQLSLRVFEVAELLSNRIAPSQNVRRALKSPPAQYSVQEVLNGAWLAWIEELRRGEDPDSWTARLQIISRLSLRGIELANFLLSYSARDAAGLATAFDDLQQIAGKRGWKERESGVLTREDLIHRLLSNRPENRLVVLPLVHPKQVGEASVDVRLGNEFYVVARTRANSFEISSETIKAPSSYYESYKLPPGEFIVLHPGEFMLGSTLEYLSLPPDLMAYVIGRSSLGRLGLIIATATHVAPGYKGTLTLELTNVGTLPIQLWPGVRIAQLVVHRLSRSVGEGYASHGRYPFAVGPEPPRP